LAQCDLIHVENAFKTLINQPIRTNRSVVYLSVCSDFELNDICMQFTLLLSRSSLKVRFIGQNSQLQHEKLQYVDAIY